MGQAQSYVPIVSHDRACTYGGVPKRFYVRECAFEGVCKREREILQGARALEGSVASRAEDVIVAPRDTHRIPTERTNAWALIISREEGSALIPDGEDSIWVTNPERRASTDLHGALSLVDGLDETAVETLEELVGDDLGCPRDAVDEVANDLSGISRDNQKEK